MWPFWAVSDKSWQLREKWIQGALIKQATRSSWAHLENTFRPVKVLLHDLCLISCTGVSLGRHVITVGWQSHISRYVNLSRLWKNSCLFCFNCPVSFSYFYKSGKVSSSWGWCNFSNHPHKKKKRNQTDDGGIRLMTCRLQSAEQQIKRRQRDQDEQAGQLPHLLYPTPVGYHGN